MVEKEDGIVEEENAETQTPAVEPGVEDPQKPSEASDPEKPVVAPEEEVDENGVPLKNRMAEYKRRNEELKLKAEQLKQREYELSLGRENPPASPAQELSDYEKEQVRMINETVEQRLEIERRADGISAEILDKLAEEDPDISKVRTLIEKQLRSEKAYIRMNPNAVSMMAYATLGKNRKGLIPKPVAAKKSTLVKSVETLTPSEVSHSRRKVTLTKDEMQFAEKQGLFDKGFDDEEIKNLYNRKKK